MCSFLMTRKKLTNVVPDSVEIGGSLKFPIYLNIDYIRNIRLNRLNTNQLIILLQMEDNSVSFCIRQAVIFLVPDY